MKVLLEDFDEKHIRLLDEMATILKFRINKFYNDPDQNADPVKSEEKKMTLAAMQASKQTLAEVWDKEDDNYWNSYL